MSDSEPAISDEQLDEIEEEGPQYGLPVDRDPDTGKLSETDYTYNWGGERVTIRLVPPTIGQLEKYENMGEDVNVGRLQEIVDEHLIQPKKPVSDMTTRELNCYMEGIMTYGMQEGQMGQAIQDQISKRDSGNQT